jgi:NAD(P)-dependent dehydrogenase (short-subunit alcohol dehydrogenase family)
VIVHSRDEGRARKAADDLQAPDQVLPVACDVADEGASTHLVSAAVEHFGGLDILINNAGITAISPSLDLSTADFQRCIDVDLTGAFTCSRDAGRHFREAGGGSIVNIASITGFRGFPNRAAYSAAKHGMLGLTRTLAAEWGEYGIRVNGIAPAYIATPMDDENMLTGDYVAADVEGRTPLGRKGTPEEVAAATVFMASDEASYITGVTLPVDGGWLAYGSWGSAASPPRLHGAGQS